MSGYILMGNIVGKLRNTNENQFIISFEMSKNTFLYQVSLKVVYIYGIYIEPQYTISLTTVGYRDIYAVSMAGKVITMISSVFGIAIVALPAGIITAGYMEELNKDK